MKIKVVPLLAMLSLMLAGINVIAFEDNILENNNMHIDLVKDHFSFSKAIFAQDEEYFEINVEEANTVLGDIGKPMVPSNTKTYTFPRGTKIKDVKCTISDVTTQIISGKIRPTPEPIKRISLVNTIEKEGNEEKAIENIEVYSSSDLYPDRWYDYKTYSGLVDGVPSAATGR